MSFDKKYSPFVRQILVYIIPTTGGLICAALLIPMFAAVMDALELSPDTAAGLALVTLGISCAVSGFLCGAIKKARGLRRGFFCAVIMLSIVLCVSLVRGSLDGASALAKCLTAVIGGCAGGVLGVNVTER